MKSLKTYLSMKWCFGIGIICVAFFLVPIFSYSQTVKKESKAEEFFTKIYYGGGVQAYHLLGTYFLDNGENETTHNYEKSKVNTIMPELQFYLGRFFPVKSFKNDSLVFGISPNISFGAGKNKFDYSGSLEAPVYATVTTGFRQNPRKKFCYSSLSGGIGASYQIIYSQFDVNTFYYICPSAMIDVSAKYSGHIYTLRFSGQLWQYQYYYSSYTGDIPGAKMRSFAIHFLVN